MALRNLRVACQKRRRRQQCNILNYGRCRWGGELPLCALQFSILNRLEVGVEVDNTSPLKILQHIWPFGASYFSRAKFSSLNLCLYLELLKIIKLTVLKKTRKKCQIFFLFLCYRPTFLSRVSIDTAILSVAVRYSIETTQHIVSFQSSPYGRPIILFCECQTASQNSDVVIPCGDDKNRWDIKKIRDF